MASASAPLRGIRDRPERDWLRLPLLLPLRGTRARAERDPERATPARCIHSWPEWAPKRGCVGPYLHLGTAHVFGPSGILSVFALLWSLPAPLRGVCARPERDPKPVCGRGPGKSCGLSRVNQARCFFMIMDLSLSCG